MEVADFMKPFMDGPNDFVTLTYHGVEEGLGIPAKFRALYSGLMHSWL